MIVGIKEVQKEFNLAIRHFRNAVKMAKKNLVVGQISFPETKPERKPRTRKAKGPVRESFPAKDLPDKDKEPYMLPRGKEVTP